MLYLIRPSDCNMRFFPGNLAFLERAEERMALKDCGSRPVSRDGRTWKRTQRFSNLPICQFGWLQGIGNSLKGKKIWLRGSDLN